MEGEWTPYTGDYINKNNTKLYKNSSELQIDHTVPLKNAYISAVCNWTYDQRFVYANDRTLGHLSIMVNYLNTEKGDNTPYKWLPLVNELRYISNWIAIKYRYNLKLSINEFNTLHKLLDKYKEFIPDEPIKTDEEKGNSLKIITKYGREFSPLLKNTKYNDQIQLFKYDYFQYIKNCETIKKKDYFNSTPELTQIRNILKTNNYHSYFGVLHPELIDILSDNDVCNLFK